MKRPETTVALRDTASSRDRETKVATAAERVRLKTENPESPAPLSAPPLAADPEQICQRAYELYVQNGCRDGHAEEDWFAAKNAIREEK